MILTSPSDDVDQTPPVTTTFDPPKASVTPLPVRDRRHRELAAIEWDRVEKLYSFVRARALERLCEAERRRDAVAMGVERDSVHAIEQIFDRAREGQGVVAACAIIFFRARAMRDADHADFLGEWLGAAEHRAAS
jgi:hypothetical protein